MQPPPLKKDPIFDPLLEEKKKKAQPIKKFEPTDNSYTNEKKLMIHNKKLKQVNIGNKITSYRSTGMKNIYPKKTAV